MKTFRFLGMALLAIVMCVNFTSCSDDGEEPAKNEDGVITNQKQLVQIKRGDDSEYTTWDYTYDFKGRLTSIIRTEKYNGRTERKITNYSWGNNIIVAEDGNSTRTYTLSNNLVKSISETDGGDWGNATFTYNSSNQLIAVQNIVDISAYRTYVETYTYAWDNGKITTYTYTDSNWEGEDVYKYIYSGKTCNGHCYILYSPCDNDDIFYVHPELIGLRCSQLLDQIYYRDDYDGYEVIQKYSYTFDKDGYVKSSTEIRTITNDTNHTDTRTRIFTFTWE